MELFKPLTDRDTSLLIEKMKANYKDSYVRILCFAMTITEYKKEVPRVKANIYAPNGDYSDFTIFIYFEIMGMVFLTYHSESDEGCRRLRDALESTKLFNQVDYLLIPGLHDMVHQRVGVDWSHMKLVEHEPSYIYTMSSDEALQVDSKIPEEVEVRDLTEEDAELVNSLWPHRMDGTDDYIKQLVNLGPSVGLFRRSDNKILSWAVRSIFGAIGFVQTIDEAKRRGYARVVVAELSQKFAQRDFPIHADVHVRNVNSTNLFLKMGFTKQFKCHYLKFDKSS